MGFLTPNTFTNVGNPAIDAVAMNANFAAIAVRLNRIFDITDPAFGAVGDGVTDDTVAINAAITAANAAGGGSVYAPNGTYRVATRTLLGGVVYACVVMQANVTLIGESRAGAIIKLGNGVQACVVGGYTGANDCSVQNITLDGNRANQTESNQDGNQCGLFLYTSARTVVSRVTTQNCQRQGYYDSIITWSRVDDLYSYNCGAEGFSCSNSYYGAYSKIIANACGQNSAVTGSYHSGIYINGGNIECTFVGLAAQSNAGYGFSMNSDSGSTDCVNNTFLGVSCHNNTLGNYIGSATASTFVARNRFVNFVSRLDGSSGNPALWLDQVNDCSFYGLTIYDAQNAAGLRLTKSSRNRFEDFVTFDDQGTHTQSFGVQEDNDAVNCIENIFLRPYFGGGFTSAAYTLYNSVVQGAVGAANFYRPVVPTLGNSWVTYAGMTPTYYKDGDGNVRITGAVMSGTLTSAAFTLPVGYRPASDVYAVVDSNGAFGTVYIAAATGNVTPLNGSNVYFIFGGLAAWPGV